jgi:hypothetical protein
MIVMALNSELSASLPLTRMPDTTSSDFAMKRQVWIPCIRPLLKLMALGPRPATQSKPEPLGR